MSVVALHLNDARCAAMSGSGAVRSAPAFAYLTDTGLTVGSPAYAESRRHPRSVKNRFVYELTTEPLRDTRFAHLSPADLLAALLEDLLQDNRTAPVVFVVPAFMDKAALGVLLGIASALDINVAGLIDSAVAASRRRVEGSDLVHVELGLHAAVLTLIDQESDLGVARHVVVDECGIEALRQRWLEAIAAEFVEQSRFDPLHSAEVEQLAVDSLDEWLAELRRGRSVAATVSFSGVEHQAVLEPTVLTAAVAGIFQRLADSLRALARAGQSTTVQMDASVDALPGMSEYLRSRAAVEVLVIDPDAPLSGTLARIDAIERGGTRRLLRVLPADQAPVAAVAAVSSSDDAPTHILFGSAARPLNGEALMIGSGQASAGRRLKLPDGLAGVSQNHCSVHRESAGCVLADHSRYGTYLNGNRVHGSTLLKRGDVVRVGTPGVELKLISVVADDAA